MIKLLAGKVTDTSEGACYVWCVCGCGGWCVCGCVCVCVCVCVGVVYTRSIDDLGFTCVEHLSNLSCHQRLASTCENEWASYIIYTK